jgi:hypothetical protein
VPDDNGQPFYLISDASDCQKHVSVLNDALGSCDAAGNQVNDATCSIASDPVGAANMFQTGSSDCSAYATALNTFAGLASPQYFQCYGNVLIVAGTEANCLATMVDVDAAAAVYYSSSRANGCDSRP